MAEDIAVGTKVFKREQKLKNLLNSVPESVKTVYVADDGNTDERAELYSMEYHFNLEVIDLEYDKGLGAGRQAIVDALEEDYLVIVDSDHILPQNIDTLREIIQGNDCIGGVAGAIIEPSEPVYYITGQFLKEKDNNLYRSPFIQNNVDMETINGNPFIHFDFIANAAMFRKECLESYSWDPEYVIGYEHIDFYVGHWKQSDWEFGVCPSVVFEHYPGGNIDYAENRNSEDKLSSSEEYFLEKWGYSKDIVGGFRWVRGPASSTWYHRETMDSWQKALMILIADGPVKLAAEMKRRLFS